MTVDSNARREAILFEISAVATRYEQDIAPATCHDRSEDLRTIMADVAYAAEWSPRSVGPRTRELAGRCVAWLEHFEAERAKA